LKKPLSNVACYRRLKKQEQPSIEKEQPSFELVARLKNQEQLTATMATIFLRVGCFKKLNKIKLLRLKATKTTNYYFKDIIILYIVYMGINRVI